MKNSYLIKGAELINEGLRYFADIYISEGKIRKVIFPGESFSGFLEKDLETIDGSGKILIPGVIDDQVHFREPGLTDKGDLNSESRAAAVGGVTSFMEMPNTIPNTLSQALLNEKYELGAAASLVNYSFYMGASNDNLREIVKTDPAKVCGIKVFMGASTGNMLVDNPDSLRGIFSESPCLIATHCEYEPRIQANFKHYHALFSDEASAAVHPLIRDAEACYRSSSEAIELAVKHDARLHVLHLSTAREMTLFRTDIPLEEKKITAEVCLHHLWFSDEDYQVKGNWIKWNPAIKSKDDRTALWQALLEGRIDVVATDHAPHTKEEKMKPYFQSPSGGPMVQHLLPAMLEFYHQGKISLEEIVQKLCHNPARLFQVHQRGFIREGYAADLVLIDLQKGLRVEPSILYYKCGWSPLEGYNLQSSVSHTFVNGNLVYNQGIINENCRGERLLFDR